MTESKLSAIHFLNGMIIIGEIYEEDTVTIGVKHPIVLAMKQSAQGVSMNYVPVGFPLYQDVKTQPKSMSFNQSAIVSKHKLDTALHNDLISTYQNMFSSVILPTSGLIGNVR